MRRFNAISGELDVEQDRPGFRWQGRRGLGREAGLRWLGASVIELPDGEWSFPYHYHHGVEEWLFVVAGTPVLRDPGGERPLSAGDLVCFPSGPEGAHAVRGPGRIVLFSGVESDNTTSISVYPDSAKVGTRPSTDGADRLDFRRGDHVDYWDGE